jgi:hypothetical protein
MTLKNPCLTFSFGFRQQMTVFIILDNILEFVIGLLFTPTASAN